MDVRKLGKLIKTRRGSMGLTQGDLAQSVFGDAARKGDVSRLENARVSNPHQATLQRIFTALDLDHSILLELEGIENIDQIEQTTPAQFLTLAQRIAPNVSTPAEAYQIFQRIIEDQPAGSDDASQHQALRVRIVQLNAKGAKKQALQEIESAYSDLRHRRAALRTIGLELLEMAEAQSLSLRQSKKAANIGLQRLIVLSKSTKEFQEKVYGLWTRDFNDARHQSDGLILRYLAALLRKCSDHIDIASPPIELLYARAKTQLEIAGSTSRDEDYFEAAEIFDRVISYSEFSQAEFRAQALHDAGVAWRHVGALRADQEALNKSVTLLKSALRLRPHQTMPEAWSLSQNAMGAALHSLGEMTQIDSYFDAAIEAFEMALRVRRREFSPQEWATTQQNLGAALRNLADIRNDEKMARQAVDAFQNALSERSEEFTPFDWATTQNNLGGALALLGEVQRNPQMMQEAVNAFRCALRVFSQDTMPLDWARARINVSIALRSKFMFSPRDEEILMAKQALAGVEPILIEHGAKSMLGLFQNVNDQLAQLGHETQN